MAVFSINVCVVVLMFPFVTVKASFGVKTRLHDPAVFPELLYIPYVNSLWLYSTDLYYWWLHGTVEDYTYIQMHSHWPLNTVHQLFEPVKLLCRKSVGFIRTSERLKELWGHLRFSPKRTGLILEQRPLVFKMCGVFFTHERQKCEHLFFITFMFFSLKLLLLGLIWFWLCSTVSVCPCLIVIHMEKLLMLCGLQSPAHDTVEGSDVVLFASMFETMHCCTGTVQVSSQCVTVISHTVYELKCSDV